MSRPSGDIRALISLSWPLFVSQMAVMANGIIDTAMAGQRSASDLAAVAIGSSVYYIVYVGLMGALQAISPIAAQHYGAGRMQAVGETWRQGQWMALVLLVPGLLILAYPEPMLAALGADPEVAAQAARYLRFIALGLPAALWFRAFTTFNAAVSRPRTVMLINLLGPVCKVPLNLVFLDGSNSALGLDGLPALGGAGCGLSTAVVAWTSALIGLVLLRGDPYYLKFSLRGWGRPRREALRELLMLGLPMGGTYLIDVSAFQLMTLLIARSGTEMTGASAIAGSLAATIFMLPLALGNATCVLCAQHLGAQSAARARATAWLGLKLTLLCALLTAALIGLLRDPLARLYTSDPGVIAITVSLFGLVAFYHVFDALQCVLAFVLRAWKIALAPMIIFAGSLWGVGVGGGWWLAHGLGWQAQGFWTAAGFAVAVAALGLTVLLLRQWSAENARGSA
jgi:MATE family multidrug resistance protein